MFGTWRLSSLPWVKWQDAYGRQLQNTVNDVKSQLHVASTICSRADDCVFHRLSLIDARLQRFAFIVGNAQYLGGKARIDRWTTGRCNWFFDVEPAFEFLSRAIVFLRQYNIDGINLFQTVVKTQSYVAFMRILSLTAAMLFGTSKPSSLGHHQVILSVQHSTALLLLYPVQDASFDLTMLTCHEELFRPFSKGFVAWLIFETWIWKCLWRHAVSFFNKGNVFSKTSFSQADSRIIWSALQQTFCRVVLDTSWRSWNLFSSFNPILSDLDIQYAHLDALCTGRGLWWIRTVQMVCNLRCQPCSRTYAGHAGLDPRTKNTLCFPSGIVLGSTGWNMTKNFATAIFVTDTMVR